MPSVLHQHRRDLYAILWTALALFLTASLASYNPADLSLNTVRTVGRVDNACGYLGSFVADALYQLLGLASWGFVAMAGYFAGSLLIFRKDPMETLRKGRWLWVLAQLLTVASLMSLHFPNSKFFLEQIRIGGVVGYGITIGLSSALNAWGVTILLWTSFLALTVLLTERPLAFWFGLWVAPLARFSRGLLARAWTPSTTPPKPGEPREPKVSLGVISKTEASVEPRAEKPLEEPTRAPLTEKVQFRLRQALAAETPKRKLVTVTPAPQVENWRLPAMDLLRDPDRKGFKLDEREIERKASILVDKLKQFDVNGDVVGIRPGPAVTLFEFKPNADVKISKITELADDLSLALSSESVRIIAPIPGRDVVGIETSNSSRETVFLKDGLTDERFWNEKFKLPIVLGREANGEPKVVDLRKMPHLLVAGTTGSGKSVFVVSTIVGLLFRHSPKSLRLILIDPKQVDLAAFSELPHLLMPAIREAKKAVSALKWAIREMDKRYRSMSQFGARGLEGFNEAVEKLSKDQVAEHQRINEEMEQGKRSEQYYFEPLPHIVIVVEEFGDLMAVDRVNVEQGVVRLAQMARACGIHLILAMQSPRKDVVTGLIKTNIPGRISFKVASKMDSRIILDDSGAERLLAQGDMLFLAPGVSKPQRHHGPWLAEEEINALCAHWTEQGQPQYDPGAMKVLDGSGGGYEFSDGGGEEDPMEGDEDLMDEKYDEILAWVSSVKEVSASLLQRRFRLGYPRAARMIEIFEREGVVGPAQGSKPRQVLISSYAESSPSPS